MRAASYEPAVVRGLLLAGCALAVIYVCALLADQSRSALLNASDGGGPADFRIESILDIGREGDVKLSNAEADTADGDDNGTAFFEPPESCAAMGAVFDLESGLDVAFVGPFAGGGQLREAVLERMHNVQSVRLVDAGGGGEELGMRFDRWRPVLLKPDGMESAGDFALKGSASTIVVDSEHYACGDLTQLLHDLYRLALRRHGFLAGTAFTPPPGAARSPCDNESASFADGLDAQLIQFFLKVDKAPVITFKETAGNCWVVRKS